ncbi:peptide chain release factor N(5)-glutamine methyltransferase [Bacillus shivajii]|uniref:peptide chain release factor N(5)-glutamine methyltransferase n=1 Tax=Bacillus shivajii TaxID=1983719 RepID=UPI001CFA5101|nr:peptide chain release factor N(5)-glutamine methyltransferase [Bacillus shivajii]UCZ53036.1 peptide chain release factor N(5)-glutamine methyltransferase [Bacillus shivajii]
METTNKVYEVLQWASSFLEKSSYESTIAERLLIHHTGWSRAELLSELQTPLPANVYESFIADVKKSAAGIPVQHLIGEEEFYGRSFEVNKNVLIPRPETEELVQLMIGHIRELHSSSPEPARIIDVGAGSGIIGITLNLEIPNTRVSAVDLSPDALAVAKRNNEKLGASVEFFEGDLLSPFIEAGQKADVIVSNPPYIPESDRTELKENVRDHEPDLALFADDNGLAVYKRLIAEIPKVLALPGLIGFEIGHGQGEDVRKLVLSTYPQAEVSVHNDINGNERIVFAKIKVR